MSQDNPNRRNPDRPRASTRYRELTLRIPEDLFADLEAIARTRNVDVEDVAFQAIERIPKGSQGRQS